MHQPNVRVTINKKTGTTTIEANGFQGSNCLAATKALTDKLGPAAHQRLKPEFYDEPETERERQYE